MDNRVFDVNGVSDQLLRATISLAFLSAGYTSAVSWKVVEHRAVEVGYGPAGHGANLSVPVLAILPWRQDGDTPFPAPVGAEGIVPSITGWLFDYCIKGNRYPQQQEIDGSLEKGWRIYVEPWGTVGGLQAIFGVKPEWALYGK